MKICVQGLWHLGTVMAGCLATTKNSVVGLDFDQKIIDGLNSLTELPIYEPHLLKLIEEGRRSENLVFTSDVVSALAEAEIWWISYDTEVNNQDEADINKVIKYFEIGLSSVSDNCIVVFSSQLPVGTIGMLYKRHERTILSKGLHFACIPENLRLGDAIATFMHADRFVIGTNSDYAYSIISNILQNFSPKILKVKIESAEMIKHAINSFLALEIVYINEIAELCKLVGADSLEVSDGLKSDARIGQRAYLRPGAGFAGGTLARDVTFLEDLIETNMKFAPVIHSIMPSNLHRNSWLVRNIIELHNNARIQKISFLGLTYKSDTNTLRRSIALDAIRALSNLEVEIRIFDEQELDLAEFAELKFTICKDFSEALSQAECLVIGNLSPELKSVDWGKILDANEELVILDQSGLISEELNSKSIEGRYLTSI